MAHVGDLDPAVPIQVASPEEFRDEVLADPGLVLVEFGAPWCPPCRILAPVLVELAAEQGDRFRLVTINTDASAELGRAYGITSIPTMLLFDSGVLVRTLVGARPKRAVLAELKLVWDRTQDHVE